MKTSFSMIFRTAILFASVCGGLVSTGDAQTPDQTSQTKLTPKLFPDLQIVKGRVIPYAPSHPLLLGKSSEIALDIKGSVLKKLTVTQRRVADGVAREPISDGYAEVRFQHRVDGHTYFNLVPLRLGRIDLELAATFSDGAFEVDNLQVDVVADAPPLKLQINDYGRPMKLDLSEEGRSKPVFVQAIYPGIKNPLYLNPKDVTFDVQMLKGAPPVQFDPTTGMLHALRVGRALITAKYQGLEQKQCVLVNENASYGPPSESCKDLLENIDKGLSTEQDADAYFTRNYSGLPYTSTDTRRGRFMADDRVQLVPPAHALKVAQDNVISLKLERADLVRVECSNNMLCQPWTGQWSKDSLNFSSGTDGSDVVHVFPQGIGELEFHLFFLFADGGSTLKTIRVPVELGDEKPQSFGKWCNRPSYNGLLPVELKAPSQGRNNWPRSETLTSTACYPGLRGFLQVPAKLVHYELHTDGKSSPVEFDAATGKATALKEGDALITQTFAGLTYATCLKVRAPDVPFEHDISNCRKLRTAYGAALPPLLVKVQDAAIIKDGPPIDPVSPHPIFGGMGLGIGGPGVPTLDAIQGATLSPDVKDEFSADSRLTLLTNGITAILGTRTTIPLRLTGPKPLEISLYEWIKLGPWKRMPGGSEEDARSVLADPGIIWRAPDGSLSVRMAAQQLGIGKFTMRVLFADGGVAKKTFQLSVKMPDGVVPELRNSLDGSSDDPFPATTLHLTAQAPANVRNLFPTIRLPPKQLLFHLSPQDVKFSAKTVDGNPVIDLDPKTGKITGLRVGHALVTMTFAGAVNQTCVIVMQDPVIGDASNCEELR